MKILGMSTTPGSDFFDVYVQLPPGKRTIQTKLDFYHVPFPWTIFRIRFAIHANQSDQMEYVYKNVAVYFSEIDSPSIHDAICPSFPNKQFGWICLGELSKQLYGDCENNIEPLINEVIEIFFGTEFVTSDFVINTNIQSFEDWSRLSPNEFIKHVRRYPIKEYQPFNYKTGPFTADQIRDFVFQHFKKEK